MIGLITKSGDLNPFSHCVTVPGVGYHSSKDFMYFKSTEMAYSELWGALQDDGSSIIGLWGMGGSGKTTLVKKVGKEAEKSKLFDRVLITTVSQTPNIRKIQGEIADMLGLKLEEESEAGRARRIAMRLQSSEERILIILDDVWAMLNFEDIGDPFGDEGPRNCKVLLTTRRLDVCTLMGCQTKTIQLNLLKEDEAWALFQTHANVDDSDEEVVAREIVVECKGLPIAIVAMGTCSKGKGVDKMNVMLNKLRNAKPNNVDKGVMDAFACLELSYDYLENPEPKLLLLMCAMFPEDHKIHVEDLLRYGVGLGLYGDEDSFEKRRSEVRATIQDLIDSSLLMRYSSIFNEEQEYVIMHDIVRDFALWKASKEDRTIIVNCTKEMNKVIDDARIKDCYAASSWYSEENKLFQFPSHMDAPNLKFQLDAPKLKFLMLCSRTPLEISLASFEGAKELHALVIMCWHKTMMKVQPQSIQWLSNLQSLRLQNLDLCDISFVVSLTRLEILDLQRSKFERMPDGIEKLNKLKVLDLSSCRINECCYKVIGMCSQLEELYASQHLRHSTNTNCYEFLMGAIALRKLRRYELEIGSKHSKFVAFDNKGTRSLRLGQLNMSLLGSIIKDLAQRATAIEFYELKGGSKSFMANIVQAVGGMNELTNLCLERCTETECITDGTTPHEVAVIPRLDELELRHMKNLKQLHRGPYPFSLFQKLEILTISRCPKLLHIFPPDCNLGKLRLLEILYCPMLTSLFTTSVACTLFSLEEISIEGCSELKHVVEGKGGGDAWENSRFPELKILSVVLCEKLEFICPIFLALKFIQLRKLYITEAPKMKFVFDEGQPMDNQDETLLPLLEDLLLVDLPSLVGICSKRYRRRWPSIKTIDWGNCPNMELHEVKGHQLRNEELYKPLAAMESIQIDNCVAESIFHYPIGVEEQIPTFQYLKELTLKNCADLKFVFYAHICQSLPELTSVAISCCEELEAIFSGNEETQKNPSIIESCLPKLKKLEISKCDRLKFILSFKISAPAPMLPQLSTLIVSNSSQMEEVFRCSNIEDHAIDGEREITFPNMKHLQLDNLPRLANVCIGFKLHTGDFCNVKFHGCPKLMPIKSATINWTKERLVREYALKYSQLNGNESLNLPLSVLNAGELDTQSSRVEHEWQIIGDDDQEEQQMIGGIIPTQIWSFHYLHSLKVTHTKELKYLFSASTIVQNSLPKLTSLTISDCEELEEIIAENGEHQIMSDVQVHFPELRELKVERCNKLKRLFCMSMATIVLSRLRNTELKYLFSPSTIVQNSLPKLTSLTISNCEELEEIVVEKREHQIMFNVQVHFPELRELEVAWCNKLKRLFSTSIATIVLSSLRNIKLINLPNFTSVSQGLLLIQAELMRDIRILNCSKFVDSNLGLALHKRAIPELQELNVVQSRNEGFMPRATMGRIQLYNCGVECIFQIQYGVDGQIPTFQYLKGLTLEKCSRLKYVFSTHICQSLPELASVAISCCGELETILLGNEEAQKNLSIVESCMPKLKKLAISKCDKLKFLLPLMTNGTISMLPQLNTLTITNCSQMEEVFKCSNIEDHEIDSGREITFQNMRHVELDNLPRLVNVCAGFKLHTGDFCKVEVHDCPKLMLIKDATIHWAKESLVRKYVSKYSQLHDNEALNLPLSVLNVGEIDTQSPIVEHKWRVIGDVDQQETKDSERLMESEQQIVGGGIVPTQVLSFQYLHSLEVVRCVRLKFLFSASIIAHNSLPKLTSLTLSECGELEEIIAENGEHQTIVLSSLRKIELNDLPNFKSVCQGRLQVELMSYIISISDCPKFVDSSLGSVLQQLGTISVSNKDSNVIEASPSNNANEERGVISSAEELYLEYLMSLISVWEGPTSIIFQNLRILSVMGCRRLKCMLPSSVFRNLPCLEELIVHDCEELEEIIMPSSSSSSEEHHHYFSNDSSNPSLCFPQLRELIVIGCGKLKWLLPSLPSTQHLPRLRELTIFKCSQLKGLFNNNQVEIHEEEFFNVKNILPKLKDLDVEDCPIFSKTTLSILQSWVDDDSRDVHYSSDDDDSRDVHYSSDDDDLRRRFCIWEDADFVE